MPRRSRHTRPRREERRPVEAEALLHQPAAPFKSWHLREPAVLFGAGQPAPDPKTGLALYGPCRSADDPGLSQMRLGIVGTGETVQAVQAWLTRCRGPIHPDRAHEADPYLFPSFPGMEGSAGFGCRLEFPSALVELLRPVDIARCIGASNRNAAVEGMAAVLKERLGALAERESPPQVVIVALPEGVKEAAGGGRDRPKKRKSTSTSQLQLAFMDPKPLEPFSASRTLHRAVKAEGMRWNLPTQLIWPSSMKGGPDVQDDATRAWNFCTALYYKAGGVPWRVVGLQRNTCYVGISFYQAIDQLGELQTSMAQAFSDRGDGMVLRGTSFKWDLRQGAPRLSRTAARDLIAGVIEQYRIHLGHLPGRMVVHKSSAFSPEEITGMREAIGTAICEYDFLSVVPSSVRFLRLGREPPVRGTVIELAPRRYVLYSRGYVPFLGVYPGLRIPLPLQVDHPEGTAPVTNLLGEFLALTRLNWNSADFAAAEPITLGFSRNVGLILSELPADIHPQRSFRFYM